MSKPSQIIVVVEDKHHRMLVYRYLLNCGLKTHEITISESPAARGSADRWVLEEFVRQTRAYRDRQHRARTALIVIMDADRYMVQERFSQLAQALQQSGEPLVNDTEQIAQLFPKRNIETWILCLSGGATLDEDTDYKYTRERHEWRELIPPAAEALCQWIQSKTEPPAHCVSSLRIGVEELKRLRY